MAARKRSHWSLHAKRFMDLAIAIPLVVLLLPVMVGIAIAILITMGRPVIFKQVRPGLSSVRYDGVNSRIRMA